MIARETSTANTTSDACFFAILNYTDQTSCVRVGVQAMGCDHAVRPCWEELRCAATETTTGKSVADLKEMLVRRGFAVRFASVCWLVSPIFAPS